MAVRVESFPRSTELEADIVTKASNALVEQCFGASLEEKVDPNRFIQGMFRLSNLYGGEIGGHFYNWGQGLVANSLEENGKMREKIRREQVKPHAAALTGTMEAENNLKIRIGMTAVIKASAALLENRASKQGRKPKEKAVDNFDTSE